MDEEDAQLHGAKYDLLLNMGQAYRALKDYDKAVELYDEGIALIEAMKIKGELFETEYLISLYHSRANVERDLENHAASIKFYSKALEIADAERQAGKFINPNLYSSIKNSLATAYEKTSDLTTAKQLRGTVNTAELNKSHLLHSAPAKEKIFYRNASDADDELYERAMDLIYEIDTSNRQRDGIKLLHEAANAGNVKAMNILGMAYHDGKIGGFTVGKKPVEAAKWFSKAAELGHLGAMDELAKMYLVGEGVEKDVDKALELFTEAANLGDTNAMHNLGRLYHFGVELPREEQKALEWYSCAADNGYLPARKNLLRLKNFMVRIEKLGDDTDAIAKEHEAETLFLFGELLFDGFVIGKDIKQNFQNALSYFKRSAALGNANALALIGMMYNHGIVVKENLRKACKLFIQAAEAGSDIAFCCLGSIYMNALKWNLADDKEKVLKYLHRAVDAGNESAMYNLGMIYLEGIGMQQDLDKAFDWLTKAASFYHIDAVNKLSDMYYDGYSPKKFCAITDLLVDVLTTKPDNENALRILSDMYLDKKLDRKYFNRLANILLKAADLYNSEAMAFLAFMYVRGDGVPENSEKALALLNKAQELGSYIASAMVERYG